ncbi:MAG: M48 family metallopeptidase [Myxococcota bacterium]
MRSRWLGVLLLVVVVGCSHTMTGRRQLTLIDDAKMDQLGVAAFADLKNEGKVSQDVVVNAYVECISTAIIEVIPANTGYADTNWEVLVFEDETPNAFALPGAKIGVHTGMLDVAVTPGQLAAVIGHEVGHVLLRHGNERMSQSILADTALQAGQVAAGVAGSQYQDVIMGGLGLGAQYGVLLPFSRKHESEADEVGQIFMAQAGFDPSEAIALWQAMGALGGERPQEWQSTHPSDETRVSKLRANLPEAMEAYDEAQAQGKAPSCIPPVVYE